MACWTVFEERQALSTTFLSDAASSLSSFMAMDSAGVVTSQVARRGRVVVSPPIFSLVRVCWAGCYEVLGISSLEVSVICKSSAPQFLAVQRCPAANELLLHTFVEGGPLGFCRQAGLVAFRAGFSAFREASIFTAGIAGRKDTRGDGLHGEHRPMRESRK